MRAASSLGSELLTRTDSASPDAANCSDQRSPAHPVHRNDPARNAHWQCWAHIPEAVRQGHSQAEQALGMDLFTYFAQEENAEEAALFAQAMGELSGLIIQRAVATVDTSEVFTAVDVGGSNGDSYWG